MVTTGVDLSRELEDWVRIAGIELTQGSRSEDGRTVLWNRGGEVRYFVDLVNDWYVITSSDRMSNEAYEFAGASMPIIEKYLYGYFGGSVRSGRGLPPIRAPFRPDEIRPGYSIDTTQFGGRKRHTLVDSHGKVLAIAGIEDLVELSHYLDTTVDVIKHSYLDPGGKPLFALWQDTRGDQPFT